MTLRPLSQMSCDSLNQTNCATPRNYKRACRQSTVAVSDLGWDGTAASPETARYCRSSTARRARIWTRSPIARPPRARCTSSSIAKCTARPSSTWSQRSHPANSSKNRWCRRCQLGREPAGSSEEAPRRSARTRRTGPRVSQGRLARPLRWSAGHGEDDARAICRIRLGSWASLASNRDASR